MNTHVYNIQIRVLVCREEGEFAARALEMDLLGYGKTEEEAIEQLKQAIEAQISFAHQMSDAELLGFPAEKEYFQRWEEAQQKAFRGMALGDKPVKLSAKAVVLTYTESELKAVRARQFKRSNLICA